MRVISKDEQERITKCCCCKSKIAYKMEDISLWVWNEKVIRCPVCKQITSVSIFDKKIKNK